MNKSDWKFTYEFLNRYGRLIVKELKKRAPVETGSLRADINYQILTNNSKFNLEFYIDDHITPPNSKLNPSEYGNILDESAKTHYRSTANDGNKTQGWFSDEIPGYGVDYFKTNLRLAMIKDIENNIQKEIKKR